MNCDKTNQSLGFTLIELVVSLTIMAMISAVVLSGLRSGMLAWDKGTKHLDDLRRSRVAFEIMHDAIAGALPITYTIKTEKGPVQKLAFDAGPDAVRFASRMSFKDGPNTVPRWIAIRWVRSTNESSGRLVVEERVIVPPDNLPGATVYWSGTVIEADRCSFDFVEFNSSDKPLVWLREWRPQSDQLPRAVRIRCVNQSKETVSVAALEYAASFAAGLRLN